MPHFGLMDETQMSKAEAALMRARLHIRGGKRRLSQNKVAAGLATLYDALLSAMRWYILSNDLKDELAGEDEALENDRVVYAIIKQANIIDNSLDFDKLQKMVDQSLAQNIQTLDSNEVLAQIEQVMTDLGVMPFDEDALPPEDPATY